MPHKIVSGVMIQTNLYSHLTSELYTYSYANNIIICGDLNARTGCSQDIIQEVDLEIAPRFNLDETVNSHGKSSIDFLTATKFSIINGRIAPNKDNFTYITTKSKSVVDYFLTSGDKSLREHEKLFTHYKAPSGQMKRKLRFNYKAAKNKFDKFLRQKKYKDKQFHY